MVRDQPGSKTVTTPKAGNVARYLPILVIGSLILGASTGNAAAL